MRSRKRRGRYSKKMKRSLYRKPPTTGGKMEITAEARREESVVYCLMGVVEKKERALSFLIKR